MPPRTLGTRFDEVQMQDLSRSPLRPGQLYRKASLNDFLRIARQSTDSKAGGKIVSAKSAQKGFEKPTHLMLEEVFVEGQRKSTSGFEIQQAPEYLCRPSSGAS
jgi:hypothetical protein